jgi:polyisoprenoid-binding protein YceI
MRRTWFLTMIGMTASLAGRAQAAPEKWEIDPMHSSVSFSVRHMMVSNVTGDFTKFKGMVTTDPKDVTKSTVEAEIDVASLSTRVEARDRHLKSPDFFDVAKYPKMVFRSKKVERAGQGALKVTGELTLHGVTKKVVLELEGPTTPVKSMDGKLIVGVSGKTTIDRREFGLKWNRVIEAGGVAVGEKVSVTLNFELSKAKAK